MFPKILYNNVLLIFKICKNNFFLQCNMYLHKSTIKALATHASYSIYSYSIYTHSDFDMNFSSKNSVS